jgi:pyridinium-3,5-biscarboxylic acid mononucleotide sulfurtransferase
VAAEHGVISVLARVGMTKPEVRELARDLGLPTWDKPALACLSSRFPYGEEITAEKLAQVARAEEYLRSRNFRQVRVRHHGDVARLEVGADEMERAFAERGALVSELRSAGFLHVALDLAGYASGSLNAALEKEGRKPLPLVDLRT